MKPMLLTFAGMVPIVLVGWQLAGPATQILLPKYVSTVPAMRWGMLPPLLNAFMPIVNVFNVVRRPGSLYDRHPRRHAGLLRMPEIPVQGIPQGATVSTFPQAMLIGRGIELIVCYILLIPLVFRGDRAAG